MYGTSGIILGVWGRSNINCPPETQTVIDSMVSRILEYHKALGEAVIEFGFRPAIAEVFSALFNPPSFPIGSLFGNLEVDEYVRRADKHYPHLVLFARGNFGAIDYGVRSIPADDRYQRDAYPRNVANPEKIKQFLGEYMEEVKDLENIPNVENIPDVPQLPEKF